MKPLSFLVFFVSSMKRDQMEPCDHKMGCLLFVLGKEGVFGV